MVNSAGATGLSILLGNAAGGFDAPANIPLAGAEVVAIGDLIEDVKGLGLPDGTENSLIMKLQAAINALNAGDLATGCTKLADFINEVSAQSRKKISVTDANFLIDAANHIKTVAGCP